MSTRTYTLYSASTYRINEGNEYLLYCTLYSVPLYSAITYSINEGNYVVPSPTVPVPTVLM